jgi:hypothetical protein
MPICLSCGATFFSIAFLLFQIGKVVTAFTAGHSVTLAAASRRTVDESHFTAERTDLTAYVLVTSILSVQMRELSRCNSFPWRSIGLKTDGTERYAADRRHPR